MKTFRSFLQEAPYEMGDFPKDENHIDYTHTGPQLSTNWKHVSTFKGHHLMAYTFPKEMGGDVSFRLVHPDTKKVAMQIDTSKEGHKQYKIGGLYGQKNSPVKAHELYHHIIHHHGIELRSDDTQSEGGKKVWKKLADMPDIHMTHHSNQTGEEMELRRGNKWDDNYGWDSHFRATKKVDNTNAG